MASWFPLWMDDLEAHDLRAILEQNASPGSFQSRLLQRLDAAVDEAKRTRFPRASRHSQGHDSALVSE